MRSFACRRTLPVTIALAIALACDGGLAPSAATGTCPAGFVGACGIVTFRGAIPESTQVVYVVAYQHFPQSTGDLLLFQPLSPPTLDLPNGATDTTAAYQLPLPAGHYEWVLAVWKKIGTLTLSNADTLLREAGFYRDPANPAQPGAVDIVGSRDSLNFVVDFNNMHPVSFYFPPATRK